MKTKGYKSEDKHPYMHTFNWTSGKLCFWRNSHMYSDKTKKYFEDTLKRWVKEENNTSSLKQSI